MASEEAADQRETADRRVWLLMVMAGLTGLVDATSYLGLGHVFVANMTGNVVFLAFALAGAPGLSADLSALALVGFLTGAALAGRIGRHSTPGRHWLLVGIGAQVILLGAALLAAILTDAVGTGGGHDSRLRYEVVVPLAMAMGLQHATARRVAVPEVPTNVLTTTLTGLVVDSRLAGGPGFHAPRRLGAPAAMFGGALLGGACLLHVAALIPLALATALALACLLATALGRPPGS